MFHHALIWLVATLLLNLAVVAAHAAAPAPLLLDGNRVTGKIMLDGAPLAEGQISFHAADGQFAGSAIKDGVFAVDRVLKGKYIIVITGPGVPEKYGSRKTTLLVVEVADGETALDFALTK